jgi:hypothetical protein
MKMRNIPTQNNNTQTEHNTQFYARLVSNRNITFLESEITLLDKELKYILHYKNKHWINRPAPEANTAVNLIDPLQQNYLRQLVAIHIQKLKQKYTTHSYNNKNAKLEWKIMKGIKDKITNNNLVIKRADKGRTVVIIEQEDYEYKILDFINNNDFIETNIDPTKQYHRNTRNVANKCNIIIPKDKKWQTNILSRKPPQMKAFIKLHKSNNPIRPVINFQNAPAYKLPKFFTEVFINTFKLPYNFNVHNSTKLITDLNQISITTDIRICSFDIKKHVF